MDKDLDVQCCSTPTAPLGEKWDTGKPDASLLLDFSAALLEVAKVGTFGNQVKGYARGSWRHVDNGVTRYTAALGRHLLHESAAGFDDESHLLHMAHTAWNALARLELELARRRITGEPTHATEKAA